MTTHPLTIYTQFVLHKEAPPPPLNPKGVRLCHAFFGIATELLELDISTCQENTTEELGDFLWYYTLAAEILGVDVETLTLEYHFDQHNNQLSLTQLKVATEEFLSKCKKLLIYQHPVEDECRESLTRLWVSFVRHCSACKIDMSHLIQKNVDKLNDRYSSSFTQEEAAKRKDKS